MPFFFFFLIVQKEGAVN